jgi:Tfp pilus assembly protein PilZ
LRQKVDLACTWSDGKTERPTTMMNLSSGGCYLESSIEGFHEEARGMLSLLSYRLPGRIVWINKAGQHEKPVGFGCEFDRQLP